MKYLLYFLLCAGVMAGTNYVYYSIQDGRPQQVAADCSYDSVKDTVSMGGIDWTLVRVGSFTAKTPQPFTNVSQVVLTPYLPMTADGKTAQQAAAQITPAMQALMDIINETRPATNQITAARLLSATTNKITKVQSQVSIE